MAALNALKPPKFCSLVYEFWIAVRYMDGRITNLRQCCEFRILMDLLVSNLASNVGGLAMESPTFLFHLYEWSKHTAKPAMVLKFCKV